MIYLFTALYAEAQMFIRRFHLVKNSECTPFQEFYNKTVGIRLTITGVGEIAAAAAVGSICTKYRPEQTDLLLNVGICACNDGRTGLFLGNKIIEQTTGKTFYPDILYRHNLREETVITRRQIWNRNGTGSAKIQSQVSAETDTALYEMEAAAIYQAGSYFFGPHQMLFLKLVSDDGRAESVTKEQIEALMDCWQKPILALFESISVMLQTTEKVHTLQPQEEKLFETFCMDLHASKAMRDSLRQHIRYLTLAGVGYTSIIQDMYREGLLPCRDKKEGKLRFEEFKRRLF